MSFDLDASVKSHLDEWIRLLGSQWRVTYEIVDEPIGGDPRAVAQSDYGKAADGRLESHIRFYRPLVRSDSEAEEAAIHELLHLFDIGLWLPPALHRFIARLERPLRLARKRARAT